jgi:glycosyltransferase involved in cell wall biosynthesis
MAHSTPGAEPILTLLVCTYNRADDLADLLRTALSQQTDGSFTYEILVVDNNSTDATRRVVDEFVARGHTNLRYLFEPRQGKSHALNTGLEAIRTPLYTIVDDDFVLPPGWVQRIVDVFRARPDVSFVSGKVLPFWQGTVPSWLNHDHWSAVALADYGDREFEASSGNPVCLLACAFRLADVRAAGGYDTALGVSARQIGGVEDLEILQRLWKSGRKGVYVPTISFQHKVGASRLTKRYHRRWHAGHGRFYAALRDPAFEDSSARLFDVPGHVYRQAAESSLSWCAQVLRLNFDRAFLFETRLWFCAGFFRKRLAASRRDQAV